MIYTLYLFYTRIIKQRGSLFDYNSLMNHEIAINARRCKNDRNSESLKSHSSHHIPVIILSVHRHNLFENSCRKLGFGIRLFEEWIWFPFQGLNYQVKTASLGPRRFNYTMTTANITTPRHHSTVTPVWNQTTPSWQ